MPKERADAPWMAGPVRVRKVRGPKPGAPAVYYWRAVLPDEGEPIHVWSGWAARCDPELAARLPGLAAEARAKQAPTAPPPAARTLLFLFGAWKAEQHARAESREIAHNTILGISARLVHLSRVLGDVPIQAMNEAHAAAYMRTRLTEGSAPRSLALELVTLRSAWAWGVRREIAHPRPITWPSAPKPKGYENNHRTPTPDEVLRVVEALDGWRRVAAVLLFATGARVGEIAGLRWGEIDLSAGEVHIRGKTGARTVPLFPDAIRELRAHPRTPGDDLVFAESGRHGAARIKTAIIAACKRVGVEVFTPHGLRRLACDALYSGGADPAVAAAALGHSPTVAMRHYRTARPAQIREALERAGLGRVPAGQIVDLTRRR